MSAAQTTSKETDIVSSLSRRIAKVVIAAAALAALAAPAASPAAPAPAPGWRLAIASSPTYLVPGSLPAGGYPQYDILATNIGAGNSSGQITITDTLPAGITPSSAAKIIQAPCTVVGQSVTCTTTRTFNAGEVLLVSIPVSVSAGFQEGDTVENEATISGGGAPDPASARTTTMLSSAEPSFDFLPGAEGLGGVISGPDGLPAPEAGIHSQQFAINLDFSTSISGSFLVGADGGLRDAGSLLPRGLAVNPSATSVRCNEVQLEGESCPKESQIGLVNVTAGFSPDPLLSQDPLYNMVAPPGDAASFGFNAIGVGVYTHILGGVHAGAYPGEGHYTLVGAAYDVPELFGEPVLGVQVQLWGDPSDPSHEHVRGQCAYEGGSCPVPAYATPLLSSPSSCREPVGVDGFADSWGHPGVFHDHSAVLTDGQGNPMGISDCEALGEGFKPTLEARPTTNQGDSPSGLSVDLHVPQPEEVGKLATANLRKAEVTLPEGLTLNPSSANGLEGCSLAQVGMDSAGVPNEAHASCPAASRIGSAEVITPLLDHALPGSIYVAAPYENPFNSLLAIYIVVDDPISGVIIKLAGQVEPDPNTGQLVSTFDENPQLPFTDFKLDFFGGAGGVLRTPSVCGHYATTSQMTPWSAPASGPPATPQDEYEISANCASAKGSEPNSAAFEGGVVAPIAGRYTPFVIHLRREDGSQELSKVTVTPPPGLVGKLAGIPYCPEAALASAASKSGNAEKASPSCPAASKIGTVHVAAGAGPAPYWTTGNAYLSGPYKGAPLSMAIITPASAGPYDLGTVVTRVALRVNPETAQITAEADPIPQILKGIVLDVRSINVEADREQFIRTGTSCNPLSIGASLTSALGQSSSLSNPFQLGNCTNLRFKPKLAIKLIGGTTRGAHPALRATLTMLEESANIAKAQVALPHSEFLDQAHIGTVCTRVQYAQGDGHGSACPAASIYGHATAISPLLGQPLSGPVYLRSSNHELPDLVVSLDGQIHVDLVGRVDSIKGGIRTTFETAPDAPVSKFVLSMQGAKKGLLQNSTNLCKGTHKASASFDAQSGAAADLAPELVAKCKKSRRKHHRHHRSR